MEKTELKQKNNNSDSGNRLREFLNRLNNEFIPFKNSIITDKDALNFIYEQFIKEDPGLIQSLPDLRKLAHIENTIDVMIDGLNVTDHFDNKVYFEEISETIKTINEPLKVIAINSLLNYGENANVYELLNDVLANKSSQVPHEKIKPLLMGLRSYIKENNPIIELSQDPGSLLPNELKTDRAIKAFDKAIEISLIEVTDERFKFNGSNALLAAFCGVIYCNDEAKRSYGSDKREYKRSQDAIFPESNLNKLFGVKNLGQSRLQLQYIPTGYEKIEVIIPKE